MGNLGRNFQATFYRRMNQIGTTATITRQTTAAYSTATSEATPIADEIEVKGFFDKAKTGAPGGVTDVEIGERVFCVSSLNTSGNAVEFEPGIGHTLTIGAQNYSIRRTEPEYADDVIVFHRLFLDQA